MQKVRKWLNWDKLRAQRQTSLRSNMGLSRDIALLPHTAGNGPHVMKQTQHGTSFTK